MQLEKRIVQLEDTNEEFLYSSKEIFDRIKEILTSIEVYYEVNEADNEISCICGILPSSYVMKCIRDKINSSMLIFDTLISLYEDDGKLFIFKR